MNFDLSPIIIDQYCSSKKIKNAFAVETHCILPVNKSSNHAIESTYQFTKYGYRVKLFYIDSSNLYLEKTLQYLLTQNTKNPIFLPFTSNSLSQSLYSTINKFDKNQIYCSFPNFPFLQKNKLAIHPNITAIAKNKHKDKFKKIPIFANIFLDSIDSNLSTSYILGKYYHYKKNKYNVSETQMWNYNNNHVFEIEKGSPFAIEITELETNIEHTDLPEDIMYEAGLLYGVLSDDCEITFTNKETNDTLTINISLSNYRVRILHPELEEAAEKDDPYIPDRPPAGGPSGGGGPPGFSPAGPGGSGIVPDPATNPVNKNGDPKYGGVWSPYSNSWIGKA